MMRMLLLALVVGLAAAGCAKEPPAAVVDTFCLTAKKRTWSINDTPQTIRDAEAWNTAMDRRCGVPGKA